MIFETRSRIILQSDWNEEIRSNKAKIWVNFKSQAKSLNGHLKVGENLEIQNKGDYEEDFKKNKDVGFRAMVNEKNQLEVSYLDEENLRDKKISIFQAPLHTFHEIHKNKKNINSLDVSKGGLGVSCDQEGSLLIWTSDFGEVRRELKGHACEVEVCRFFPSGVVVLTGSTDMRVKVWSAETGECAATFVGHKKGVTGLEVVERGRNVISSSRDGTVKLWDCSHSQCLFTFNDLDSGPINCLHLFPAWCPSTSSTNQVEKEVGTDGKVILFGSETGKLFAFGLDDKQKIFEYNCQSLITCLSSTSAGLLVCGTEDSKLHFIDPRKYDTPLKVLKERRSSIRRVVSHSSGCIVSSNDGSTFELDSSFKLIRDFTGPDCDKVEGLCCQGNYLYSGCRDGKIRKYKLI